MNALSLGLFVFFSIQATHTNKTFADTVSVPTVVIGEEQGATSPVVPFAVFKAERVAPRKLKDPQRQTLNDLLSDQVGVDAQVYCANCGAKRLTINGLRGEHTSLLIDGLPLHSAVSSFYGVDNVPLNGIADVLVMRGAGASLVNPEAIGGTINIITIDPLSAPRNYSTSLGVDDKGLGKSQNHSFLYSLLSEDKKWGLSGGGQFARNEAWDLDRNNVAEMPQRQSSSGLLKARWLLGNKNDFTLRLGLADLAILGGHVPPVKPPGVRPVAAQESDFVDGSVHQPYIGDPTRIMESVDIRRIEAATTGTHYLTNDLTFDWKFGYARQQQNAIYQHGYDYANIDNIFVGDTHFTWAFGSDQSLSIGAFFKDQRLRSASQVLFENRGLPEDSFNYLSTALYTQYSVAFDHGVEVDLALRADHVQLKWLELDNQINDHVLAPRLQILHEITSHLSQRFSYGLGYRAPLTFFESQHGNNERGYQVDISELERAHSLVYSLSFNTPEYYLTGGAHYTRLENMAFGFEQPFEPIFYRNTDESFDILVTDLMAGYKPAHWWLIEASLEFFRYEDGYARKLPTAAIERRTQLISTIESDRFTHRLVGQLIGSRDLSRFANYNRHYVNRRQAQEPSTEGLILKNQQAPSFVVFDTSLSYRLRKELQITVGINNLFNYTQVRAGDPPSAWHFHFTHAHFDGLHTWGPNIGRQYFVQLNGEF